MNVSSPYKLDKIDLKKIFTGFLLSLAAGFILVLADQIQFISDQIDFGVWEALSIAIVSTLVNALRKWATDNREMKITVINGPRKD